MSERNVTSIEDLASYSRGSLVELPSFGPDQPFVARLRRPSLLALARAGKIPNELLGQANKLFFGEGSKQIDRDAMSKTFEVVDVLCEASFIEPTFADIKKAGVELTDDQLMFVFNYTQQGVKALENFRNKQGYSEDNSTGE